MAHQHVVACSLLPLVVMVIACCLVGAATSESSSTMQCHEDDQAALLAVKSALLSTDAGDSASGDGSSADDQADNYLSSWSPDYFCCDWRDVECDNATGRVVGLSLTQDANLTGAIPDAIANLTHLRTLVLHHLPAVSGAIPDSLALLSDLQTLSISYTGVSGAVPAFLSQLTELASLDLSYNALTGAIPASLADHPSLSSIDISRNALSGAVPPLFTGLLSSNKSTTDGVYLSLAHNNFSGAVPAGFGSVGFAHLDLSRNGFSGDPSAAVFGHGKPLLQHLDLSRNAFRFSLTGVELPEQLVYLDLSHNGVRGRIPAQVATLAGLKTFNVSYNQMCGVVPTGGNMPTFDAYSYQHNKCLCGTPLPACHRGH
ncbi:hypothetical protein U9M48_041388 [Paspalum notatum var. saurae]|uniref:Leucine-rich repeat-containing N-terminal plant-type domain-containing protein n=1 Tax=Paspalum notatum var. saurae TaxID=547442 RepID=A0AAQ3UNN7_PASNO